MNWFPNFKDPKNEVVVVGNWIVAFLSVLLPLISDSDFTTSGGVFAFAVAAVALIQRRHVWSSASVAEVSAEQIQELQA